MSEILDRWSGNCWTDPRAARSIVGGSKSSSSSNAPSGAPKMAVSPFNLTVFRNSSSCGDCLRHRVRRVFAVGSGSDTVVRVGGRCSSGSSSSGCLPLMLYPKEKHLDFADELLCRKALFVAKDANGALPDNPTDQFGSLTNLLRRHFPGLLALHWLALRDYPPLGLPRCAELRYLHKRNRPGIRGAGISDADPSLLRSAQSRLTSRAEFQITNSKVFTRL